MVQKQVTVQWLLEGFKYEIGSTLDSDTLDYYYGHVYRFLNWTRTAGLSEEAKIEGSKTVREFLSQLAARYPRFGQIVFDVEAQKLTEKVRLFLNGRHLELVNGLETKLNDGDILTLVPPIAGGWARPSVVAVTVVELGGCG